MNKRYILAAAICLAGVTMAEASATTAPVQAVQQNGKVLKGTIVDQNGEPIIGATVLVKGTKNATVSDFDGDFTLNNASGTIVVS